MAQPTNGGDLNQHAQQQPHQQQWAQQQPHQYQQQWMAMQYPATAMAMMQQQMMMYPQHYMPYLHHHYQPPPPPPHHHHQQFKQQTTPPQQSQPPHSNSNHHQQQKQQSSGSNDEIRTIWLGDLHHWMDENYLVNCFAHTGEARRRATLLSAAQFVTKPTMKSALLRPCSAPLLLDAQGVLHHHRNRTSSSSVRFGSTTICCSSKNESYIPKLEPFSRTKLERAVKDPPLIQKSEKELADYCSTLEGDESYSCWQAYFELKDLEKESPKADIERLILETGGVKSLIGCLHGIAIMHKLKKNGVNWARDVKSEETERHCPIPDGLPKSEDELMEEEQGRLPDSPYTRLLRSKGRFPAWYSPAPDHQTD